MEERFVSGPTIRCAEIEAFQSDSWDVIDAAFATADTVKTRQFWRESPEKEFLPAVIRTARCAGNLLVYAVLDDADIFNPVTTFNKPSFQHGDVFETFLRPLGQEAYYEFHVTPQNQHFQLRIPSADAFLTSGAGGGIPDEWLIGGRDIKSQVTVDPQRQQWRVLEEIPILDIAQHGLATSGDEWLFSFSRYDYTHQVPSPVLSSTSAHTVVNFHRQEEWGRLLFV